MTSAANEESVVRAVDWRALFPWTLIFRSIFPAMSWGVIGLATLGVMANAVGWQLCAWAFVRESLRDRSPLTADFADRMRSTWQGVYESYQSTELLGLFGARINGPLLVFDRLVEPFLRMFEASGGMMRFLFLLCGVLITVAIWAFVGTAIARIALFRYTRNESLPLGEAFRFACREFPSAAACVLVPLAGVFALALPGALLGLLMTFDFGLLLGSILYVFVVLLAILMAILLLGLAFGWPLAISAVSAEGQGFFDALTRSFAYTFQRPFRFAFYVLIAILVGGLAWIVVNRTAVGVERLADWSVSWGANVRNGQRMEAIQQQVRGDRDIDFVEGAVVIDPPRSQMFTWGAGVLRFWKSLLRTLAVGFLFGHFWCLAAAIYLLLRKQVDDAEMDEIYVREEQRSYDLPDLNDAGTAPLPTEGTGQITLPTSLAETTVPSSAARPPAAPGSPGPPGPVSDSGPRIDTDPET